jgi:hypothetical protein
MSQNSRRIRKDSFVATVGVLILLCLNSSILVAQVSPPSVEQSKIVELIQQLGSESFQIREQAQAQLLATGLAAQDELSKALKSADLEIRFRVRRIYVQLLQTDFQRRLTLFVNDVDGKLEHDLPAWKMYREKVGSSLEHRKLFASIVRVEAPFLIAIETKTDIYSTLNTRLKDLQPYGSTPNNGPKVARLESIAAILLAATQLDSAQLNRIISPMYNLLNFQETKNGIRGGDNSGIIKGMIATYIEQNTETANSQLPLTLVLEYGFEDVGLRMGRKLIADSKMSSLVREYAAICLVRFGTAAEIPKLLSMLTEKSVIHSWSTSQAKGKIIKTQVRDAILVLLLHQTKQDATDYGFRFVQPNPITVFRVYSAGFIEDAEREAAHAQWKKWWDKNKEMVLKPSVVEEK